MSNITHLANMKLELYNPSLAEEVKQLFTSVFSDSEGETEGKLIGTLAYELQETTSPGDLFGFIARDEDKIVSCIFFSRLSFESSINAFILAPVAVATNYQKQGIGQKLINFGIKYLKEKNIEVVFTYGDPNYYSKVGFNHITEDIAKPPLKLTYPHGWLAQPLSSEDMEAINGNSTCVSALNNPKYW